MMGDLVAMSRSSSLGYACNGCCKIVMPPVFARFSNSRNPTGSENHRARLSSSTSSSSWIRTSSYRSVKSISLYEKYRRSDAGTPLAAQWVKTTRDGRPVAASPLGLVIASSFDSSEVLWTSRSTRARTVAAQEGDPGNGFQLGLQSLSLIHI